MSIMVEYNLPEWCEGCKRLNTMENRRADNDVVISRTCSHLEECKVMREQWNLSNEVYKPKGIK